MKRVLIGLAIALAAASSQAAYLYWQVSGTEANSWWTGGTLSQGLSNAGVSQITTMRVVSSAGTAVKSYDLGSGTQVSDDYGYVTLNTAPDATPYMGGNLYADLGSGAESAEYTYYIEISGYGGSYNNENTVLAVSGDLTYAQLSGHVTTDLKEMATIATAWTGGTYAAPEPTSGLLLLVGASLLALKRRKV